jgi:hypothetical protein
MRAGLHNPPELSNVSNLVLFLASTCENPSLFPVNALLWRVYVHHFNLGFGARPAMHPIHKYAFVPPK